MCILTHDIAGCGKYNTLPHPQTGATPPNFSQISLKQKGLRSVWALMLMLRSLIFLVAPPLSVEEVLKAVAGVTNWRKLGKVLIGEQKEPPLMKRYTNLDRVHDTYKSDEARLRAVVEEFIAKTDRSWRRVICALRYAEEIDKAQQISSYAEPLQGMCCVVSGIARVWLGVAIVGEATTPPRVVIPNNAHRASSHGSVAGSVWVYGWHQYK
jgi:hypothetical protein